MPIQFPTAVIVAMIATVLLSVLPVSVNAANGDNGLNLAPAAKARTSFVSGNESLPAIQEGVSPHNSQDHSHGCYGNWPERGTQWVQYVWSHPISINGAALYWWDDHRGIHLPASASLSYWNGSAFVPTFKADVAVLPDQFNTVHFSNIKTTKLRLTIKSQPDASTGVIEWKVFDSGDTAAFAPVASAGEPRVDVIPAPTYLHGSGRGVGYPGEPATTHWSKESGPGEVTFADADSADTTATFSEPGDYVLEFAFGLRGLTSTDALHVHVITRPKLEPLQTIYASHYKIDSPFWNDRLKNLIVHWVPHCITTIEEPDLSMGGLNNLIEAGKKLRGEPYKLQEGPPYSNAWVLNTTESMADALTLDPQGDADIIAAQASFRKTLGQWIPIILAAQEPDGYFQTRFTLGTAADRRAHFVAHRWDPRTRGQHEGYVGGYFIEAGIADYVATGGKDRRLYDAAKKLADCWVAHIGSAPKQKWWDDHEEMEQALIRLGRFVNRNEAAGMGQKYIDLAHFLLSCREGGSDYDQSQSRVTQQYQPVGHAVRAAYLYSAMAGIASETGNPAYWSSVLSLNNNIVNSKYYVTGGIGSTSGNEGFGPAYSLPNNTAYCESCSSCGMIFLQHDLNLATHNARYADIYERTLYNALLGSVDLPAENFTYTNPLSSGNTRGKWNGCPCCVGNIPRVLLELPKWMYVKRNNAVYVNLFVGSTVDVGKVAGTNLQLVQTTDYPWKGKVMITVNPATAKKFTVYVRSPMRDLSQLYSTTPAANGISSLAVNGKPMDTSHLTKGYVAIERLWKAGDTIELQLPLDVRKIIATSKIHADHGRVAYARGPLIYNFESVDQNINQPIGSPSMSAKWSPKLLDGVVSLHGKSADGSPLVAVPNYARLNRGGQSMVWVKQ